MTDRIPCQVCGRRLVPLKSGLTRNHKPRGSHEPHTCQGSGYRAARWPVGQCLRHHAGSLWDVLEDHGRAGSDYLLHLLWKPDWIIERPAGTTMVVHGEYMHRNGWEPADGPLNPQEARAVVLAGHTVRLVVGADRDDPICLHYVDRCLELDGEPMIYTESIGGWSEGSKEAICELDSDFYVKFVADPRPLSLTITDEEPPRREADHAA
jgi:hypothetical protein